MRRNDMSVRWLTFDAMALAVIAILTLIPFIGYVPIGPLSITIIHVPVLVFAYFGGAKRGWIYGAMFGILSLLRSLYPPHGVLDAYFVNPLVSVLPRIAFGLLAGIAFSFVRRIPTYFRSVKYAAIAVSAGILTLIHTCFVMGMLATCYLGSVEAAFENTFGALFLATMLTGALPECAVAVILTPILTLSLTTTFSRVMDITGL